MVDLTATMNLTGKKQIVQQVAKRIADIYSRLRFIRSKNTQRFSFEFDGDTTLVRFSVCLCPRENLEYSETANYRSSK